MKRGKHQRLFAKCLFISGIYLIQACSSQPEKAKVPAQTTATDVEKGKTLFYTRCASCHKVNEDLTGPALKGVEARWADQQKLYAFIRNSQEVIQNHKYARELWLKYDQTVMLPQPDMTDDDIRAVLDYVSSVSEK